MSGRVPHEFSDLIDLKQLPEPIYTLIAYPGMRGAGTSIVDSKSISKAIAKAASGEKPMVAVAHGFTEEALDVIRANGAVAFSQSDFHWTDQSFAGIRDR